MTSREFFIARWREEYPMFLSVLRALPTDGPDYRPHPRSRSAIALAWFLTLGLQACSQWLRSPSVTWEETAPPSDLRDAIAAYEKAYGDMASGLDSVDDNTWDNRKVQLVVRGGAQTYELPLGEMLWAVLFDAIHHRGQLALYIRLSGGKVPGIYGPSGDERN